MLSRTLLGARRSGKLLQAASISSAVFKLPIVPTITSANRDSRKEVSKANRVDELQMPALSPTMSQGNMAAWKVKEGDEVTAGDVLAEIETDKATMDWENQDDGFVAKILVPEGSKDIPVGTPLAILVEDKDNIGAFKDYSPSSSASSPSKEQEAEPSTQEQPEAAGTSGRDAEKAVEPSRSKDGLFRLGPAARALLQESGLSADDITPSGPLGIVTKEDVLAAIERGQKPSKAPSKQEPAQESRPAGDSRQAPGSQPPPAQQQQQQQKQAASDVPPLQPPGERYRDVPLTQIRKIIAQRLLESKQTVPHFYVRASAGLDEVNKLRQTMKAQGTKVSLNDFIVRAVALALAEVPAANAIWDAKAQEAKQVEGIDIAIAVATDTGLITPIVKAANTKSLQQISAEIRELAGRARANKLKPQEFQGGTFTISNLGMFGIDEFSAIINPPQACIMAVGGTQHHVVLEEGHPVAKAAMNVTLSADQRVYDGEISGDFLAAFQANMENPMKLLV